MLFANRKYNVVAPGLEPKEDKFVGYQEPFLMIRYEPDFPRGTFIF